MARVRATTRKSRDPNGKQTAKERHRLNHIHMGIGRPWQVRPLPEKIQNVKSVTLRKGNWLGVKDDLSRPFNIPFIDRFGKFTGCTLYTAGLRQQDYMATIISTISSRIFSWVRSHNDMKKINRNYLRKLCAKASAVYATTKNSYMMDRIFVLLKNFQQNKKTVTGIIASFASKLDAYKGFIHSQACSHAYWLTSRAQRPRDKSRPELHTYPFREVGISNFPQRKLWLFDAIIRTASAVEYLA